MFIAKYIFKLYLIPGVQIPTKNSGSHVDPSDVHLIIYSNMIIAYKKIAYSIL